MMKEVRLGIVGVGGMGGAHARKVMEGKVEGCRLAAVADFRPELAERFPGAAYFPGASEMIASGTIDAILIATPHYAHTSIGIEALAAGVHVLVEKPVSVHKADCERLLAAHRDPAVVFAAMFNMRIDPLYRKIKSLLERRELGVIRRINWTVTDWFRTQTYYNQGGWRATWEGEGGGVLLNQCPHQLDLWQYLFGMPESIRAFCALGRYHDIAVEDDVTAYLKYADGCTGVFITSTGEAPGTNRLEITGDLGRLVVEKRAISLIRNEVSMAEYGRTSPMRSGGPPVWNVEIPVPGQRDGSGHLEVICNFVDAIRCGVPLIAPAAEGIRSVELANAMLLSSIEECTVELPLDGARYERLLQRLIAESGAAKKRDLEKALPVR